MKLAIIGSRGITEGIEPHIPAGVTLIITGGAVGVDSLAEAYADRKKISKLVIRPDYQKYGKAAPIVRNKQIIEAADSVLFFGMGYRKERNRRLHTQKKPENLLHKSAFKIILYLFYKNLRLWIL